MAQTQDFMTTWFANNTSLPGTHRPQDAYRWLEDSDDENEKLKKRSSHIPRSAAPSFGNSASSTTLHDLRNTNGKRAFQEISPASNDPRARRMRMENAHREAVAPSGQARPSARPRTIDLSVSPPPPMRSTGYGQQLQTGPTHHAFSPTEHPPIHQPHQYTTTNPKPQSMTPHAGIRDRPYPHSEAQPQHHSQIHTHLRRHGCRCLIPRSKKKTVFPMLPRSRQERPADPL